DSRARTHGSNLVEHTRGGLLPSRRPGRGAEGAAKIDGHVPGRRRLRLVLHGHDLFSGGRSRQRDGMVRQGGGMGPEESANGSRLLRSRGGVGAGAEYVAVAAGEWGGGEVGAVLGRLRRVQIAQFSTVIREMC